MGELDQFGDDQVHLAPDVAELGQVFTGIDQKYHQLLLTLQQGVLQHMFFQTPGFPGQSSDTVTVHGLTEALATYPKACLQGNWQRRKLIQDPEREKTKMTAHAEDFLYALSAL